jgi:single-strand DNA-binding protein
MSDNNVTVVGNVTRVPEMRFTPNGASVVSFGVAVNRRWQNKQTQEWEEQVSFFDVKAWAQLADNVNNSIDKGDRVVITGRLEQETWDDKDTGAKRSKVSIVADEVALSLRWATVPQVNKNERSGGSAPVQGGRSAAQGAARPAPAAAPATQPEYADEPF